MQELLNKKTFEPPEKTTRSYVKSGKYCKKNKPEKVVTESNSKIP